MLNTRQYAQERNLMAACAMVLFRNFLTIIAAFKFMGVLILTIYRMLMGDVLRFLIVYIVLLYSFAIALYVLVHDAVEQDVDDLDLQQEQRVSYDMSIVIVVSLLHLFH